MERCLTARIAFRNRPVNPRISGSRDLKPKSEAKTELVAQNAAALHLLNRIFAAPTRALHLARHGGFTRGNGFGQRFAQIEVTPDAFVVQAIEAEHCLGMVQIDFVFDFAAGRAAIGGAERQIHFELFEFGETGSETGRFQNSLTFLFTILGPRTGLLAPHNDLLLLVH